ncbi:MAG: hypothetical protein JXB13_01105 [Phycisphaerae bacterium]|nr:hypothetical protein [Phycisphaerae bacterium]
MTVAPAQPFRRTQARPVRTGRRPRGTVMILVVALLGILFVAGAAFLQSVTFQARMVTADREQREVAGILDAVDTLVFEQLTRSWLDENGAPYVPQPLRDDADIQAAFSNSSLEWDETLEVVRPTDLNLPWETLLPTYGEALGQHPILATTEPIDNLSLCTIPTDLNRVLKGYEQPSSDNMEHWSTPIGQARTAWVNAANYIEFVMPQPVNLFDADGDGMVDSVEVVLDASNPIVPAVDGLIPRAQQLAVVEQLRASDAPLDDNRLRLSVRVISHGSMVNATCTNPLLLNNVVNDFIDPPQAAVFNVGTNLWYTPGSYRPEIEERALRYRNILPARSLAASALQTELYGYQTAPNPVALYTYSPAGGVGGTLDSHRWWPFVPDEADYIGDRYGILFDAEPTFALDYKVADAMAYDRRHLLTTVSYDDLLIRGVRFPRHPNLGNKSGRDIVEWMRSSDMRGKTVYRYRDNYPDNLVGGSLEDEYTAGLFGDQMDRRVGRLQLSIPYLDQFLVAKGGGGTGATIDNYRTRLSPQDQYHFVGMIYDTFWLMLWNHPDLDGDGTYTPWNAATPTGTDDWQRARLAASLTANFIDFADSDDEPTYVQLLDNDGSPVPYYAIGMERQPYITEVYTNVTDDTTGQAASSSVFALELYNPYTTELNLDGYSLTDESTVSSLDTQYGETIGELSRISDFSLDGMTIPPGGFKVFYGFGADPTSGTTAVQMGNDIAIDRNSVLTLRRTVTIDDGSGTPPTYDYAVDRVESQIAAAPYTRQAASSTGTQRWLGTRDDAVSLQRDTSTDAATPPNSLWRFVVPRLTRFDAAAGSSGDSIHTLEQNNMTLTDTIDPTIRPVQVDFANSGSLAAAYPTTGSLLLLMRHANELDLTNVANPDSHPFNHVPYQRSDGAGGTIPAKGLIDDYDQVDNGRMPVFDVGEPVASPDPAGSKPYYHKGPTVDWGSGKAQGVRALPWGQFVFDYFTALPLERTAWDVQLDYQQPNVDQGGLRVHGRININTAPYKVLAGMPLRRLVDFPSGFQTKLALAYSRNGQYNMSQAVLQYSPMRIGPEVARAIVAYREAREVTHGCSHGSGGNTCSFDFAERARYLTVGVARTDYVAGLRQGRGFLSVGELANVRHVGGNGNTAYPETRFDHGVVGRGVSAGIPTEDYVEAVALLVGLEEWVTNRSHVFTIYGTLRGPDSGTAASIAEADAKAIRFEETVNRLPTFFDSRAPFDRIGERFVGKYEEARAD